MTNQPNNKLPESIQEKISVFPEFSYGAHKVTLVLRDGTEIREVYVAGNDEIVRIGKSEQIYFDPTDVVGVKNEV